MALQRGRPRPWAGRRAADPLVAIQVMYVPHRRSVRLPDPVLRRRSRFVVGEVSTEFGGVLFPRDDLYPHALTFPGAPPLPALDVTSVGTSTTAGSLFSAHDLAGTSSGTSGELVPSPTFQFPSTTTIPSVGDRGVLSGTWLFVGTSAGGSLTRGTMARLFPSATLYPGDDVYPDTPNPNASGLTGTSDSSSTTTGVMTGTLVLTGFSVGTSTSSGVVAGGSGDPVLRVVQSNLQLA